MFAPLCGTPAGRSMSLIGTFRTSRDVHLMSALRGKAEIGVGQLDFRV
jgi:hypothetical protein